MFLIMHENVISLLSLEIDHAAEQRLALVVYLRSSSSSSLPVMVSHAVIQILESVCQGLRSYQ